ncbi:ser thr protein phosphatase superfamily [Ophiostoma piceae UAMH 11346]|uniref:Ser thr protein phosphatase superfamily n=1 Tax=Ophiostoma piceae (strain UAMH 11346) TaxID=1262450 RepID=S3BVI3_OPHP1|nr:ser thr protein phosphatase superfamily [Ophiostoma piceae UAMH 11346]
MHLEHAYWISLPSHSPGTQTTTMAVQIVSDLHLESPKAYDVFEIVPRAPILALVGDIGNIESHEADFTAFVERMLAQFQAVLFVPGNHEAYNSTWPRTLEILRALEKDVVVRRAGGSASVGEFVLLERNSYRLPRCTGTIVLGCSLFSHIAAEHEMAVSMGMNDFYQIGDDWDVAAHNKAHARDLAWLNDTVAALSSDDSSDIDNILIMTHWSPSTDSRAGDPRHAHSAIACSFATDLSAEACFRASKVKAWCFGHTHYNCDFTVTRDGGLSPLRLVANQRGYYFAQAAGYDNDKLLWAED